MSSDDSRNPKPEKSSTPPPDQSNVHVYPDWAAMQAYYGARGCMPPYFNPAVAPGQPPHPPYMWGPPPQHMMPPYGPPYAVYAHGGVYPHHPGMPFAAAPNAETPTKPETPTKSSGITTDQGLMKKLKGFEGLAMSIGTGNADSAEGGSKSTNSRSTETEGSCNGSYENTTEEDQKGRKRDRGDKSTTGGDKKQTRNGSLAMVVVNEAVGKATHANTTVPSETALEFKNPPTTAVVKTSPADSPQPWLQNDDKELKREKRKQSNRESARRSRLRKQAETEELAKKVEALMADNSTLRYELNRLSENSEKLKLENATLVESLKNVQGGGMEQLAVATAGEKRVPVTTENLLSRVDNHDGSADRNEQGGGDEMYGKSGSSSSKSGGKLRQLLHPNPRADTVVAG